MERSFAYIATRRSEEAMVQGDLAMAKRDKEMADQRYLTLQEEIRTKQERELAARRTTVFVTTHYLDEAEYCHRVGFLYRGRLVAVGSPDELKQGMRAGVVLEVECRQAVPALRRLRAEPSLAWVSLVGPRLHVLAGEAAVGEESIRKALSDAGIAVDRVAPIPYSLEDLFAIFIDMEERGRSERGG